MQERPLQYFCSERQDRLHHIHYHEVTQHINHTIQEHFPYRERQGKASPSPMKFLTPLHRLQPSPQLPLLQHASNLPTDRHYRILSGYLGAPIMAPQSFNQVQQNRGPRIMAKNNKLTIGARGFEVPVVMNNLG